MNEENENIFDYNDDEQIKRWVAAWDRAGSHLSVIKRKELQKADYYLKNRATLNGMLSYAFEHRTIRQSSGLVEQQRLFKILSLQKGAASR